MSIEGNILKGWDVVVIDDEHDSLDVATMILEFYGATVRTAHNGQEGLQIIQEKRPKLIISDLSMPVLDGWGLIESLKKNRASMDIPIIALTAHAMRGDRERAITAGFHNYLTKPLNPQNFMKDLLILLTDIPELANELEKNPL